MNEIHLRNGAKPNQVQAVSSARTHWEREWFRLRITRFQSEFGVGSCDSREKRIWGNAILAPTKWKLE